MGLLSRIFKNRKYKKDLEKYELEKKEQLEDFEKRIDKNQDWFFPIISAVALWGIGFIDSFSKDKTQIVISLNVRHIGIIGITLFALSIFCILLHLYLDMKWSTEKIEGKNNDIERINRIKILIDFGFWFLAVAILLSIISYTYAQLG